MRWLSGLLRPINRKPSGSSVALLIVLLVLVFIEPSYHAFQFRLHRPMVNLDEPVASSCETYAPAESRQQNAVLFMLAREADLVDVGMAVKSMETHFNQWHHYPYVFANNEAFSSHFIENITALVSAPVTFTIVPAHMWGFPTHFTPQDKERASERMRIMKEQKVRYAGNEEYHHMCRFYSGFFYDLPALQEYEWYWRIEPDTRLTCDVTYDPFQYMIQHNKVYGHGITLWELAATAKSFFYYVAEYKRANRIGTKPIWNAIHEASWAPYFVRRYLMSLLSSRDSSGDLWNLCHFWSNFEIASLSFFRSAEYRDFFDYLDMTGGFYFERWGDAAVHSLAIALFSKPAEVHHFSDIAYRHGPFQQCPTHNSTCNCECDSGVNQAGNYCLSRIRNVFEPP